jgi:cytochrome c peroxidase
MKRSFGWGSRRRLAVVVFACLVAGASVATLCHAADDRLAGTELPWDATPPGALAYARSAAITNLGHELFNDPMLSASGQLACSTCHDPAHGFSAPNAAPVQAGGRGMNRPGIRAVPGLTYGQFAPPFSEHFFESDEDGDESVDQGPTGGLDWDGRVDRARDQVRRPLLDPSEMANVDPGAVAVTVAHSG